ncbi:hypothetical protein [Streptomyces sp. A30]|uniref:hypothetical protein n=1 Tax=Streptomyces sp. A30 TaxID=2789273 RepID=UPI0039805E7D
MFDDLVDLTTLGSQTSRPFQLLRRSTCECSSPARFDELERIPLLGFVEDGYPFSVVCVDEWIGDGNSESRRDGRLCSTAPVGLG